MHVYLGLDGGVFYRRLSLTDLLVSLPSATDPSELWRREGVEDDVRNDGERRLRGLNSSGGPRHRHCRKLDSRNRSEVDTRA